MVDTLPAAALLELTPQEATILAAAEAAIDQLWVTAGAA
jgi:hypothetical protein